MIKQLTVEMINAIESFEDLIDHFEIKEKDLNNWKKDNVSKVEPTIHLAENFFHSMKKIEETNFEKYEMLRKDLAAYMLENEYAIYMMTYGIIYAIGLDNSILVKLKELYHPNNLTDRRLNMTVAVLTMIEFEKRYKDITNPNISKIIQEDIIVGFLLTHTLKASVKDKPTSTIDFKRTLIHVFNKHETFEIDKDYFNVTRALMFKLLANYLYIFDKELGEMILNGEYFHQFGLNKNLPSWNQEIVFIKVIEEKIKNKDTSSSTFIDEVALKVLKNLPNALSDRIDGTKFEATMDDALKYIESYKKEYESSKYDYTNHAEAMANSLYYYLFHINTKLQTHLLETY